MIILPNNLMPVEIRVLQEFRRLNAETLSLEAINAIRHPAGGGEAPAVSLVGKGFLSSADSAFALTQKGKDFLAIEAKPEVPETGAPASAAAAETSATAV